jgi:hypothetical protein
LGKKIIGVLLIAILTIVLTASLSYVFSQPNPTENTPSPTPTPPSTPIPIPTLTPTPTPTPSEEPTKEASILKPSVPEFAVKYVGYSYDVPPTYGIDQYTGEPVITK